MSDCNRSVELAEASKQLQLNIEDVTERAEIGRVGGGMGRLFSDKRWTLN